VRSSCLSPSDSPFRAVVAHGLGETSYGFLRPFFYSEGANLIFPPLVDPPLPLDPLEHLSSTLPMARWVDALYDFPFFLFRAIHLMFRPSRFPLLLPSSTRFPDAFRPLSLPFFKLTIFSFFAHTPPRSFFSSFFLFSQLFPSFCPSPLTAKTFGPIN